MKGLVKNQTFLFNSNLILSLDYLQKLTCNESIECFEEEIC
jgi:hypothetical protein